MICKDDFIETIESMKVIDEYQEAKNKLYKKYNADGYLIEPDNNSVVLKLLNWIFKDCTEVGAINAYCLVNHYGIGKGNQTYINEDGQKITISSPAELYDYLVKNLPMGSD